MLKAVSLGLFLIFTVMLLTTPSLTAGEGLEGWLPDTPSPTGAVAIDCVQGTAVLSTTGGADMWSGRAGAPIIWTPSPEGNFVVEATLTYPDTTVPAVAGLCVYGDENGGNPAFTYGLDHWGGTQKIKLQGLPPSPNQPGVEVPITGGITVRLRMECYRADASDLETDRYVFSYQRLGTSNWRVVAALDATIPSQRVGLFLKDSAAYSVTFTDVSLEPIEGEPKFANNLSVHKLGAAPAPTPVATIQLPPTTPDPEAMSRPLIKEQPILFVARLQYKSDHHNTATMFQTSEINTGSFTGGSALRVADFSAAAESDSPEITTILECPNGVIRDPDVSFDGTKILFSMRNDVQDDYHIYEINADGTGLTQLTSGLGLSDIDPIYMPDGNIVFGSSREPKFCMCNRHIMCNLFTMEADGANIQQIGHSTLFEGHPCLLPDGRVLYDRWEYIDRNFGDAQGVWVTNPDGTQHAIYYGNNTNSPGAVLDTRPIPGTTKVIATFSSCHDRPWGALAIIDRTRGIDLEQPVERTWPSDAINLIGVGNYDTYKRVQPKYEDPYALSDSLFLCTRMTGQGEKTGVYLLDLEGHETLLIEEPTGSNWGAFDAMPLAAREAPPTILPRTDLAQTDGVFYVSDVYIGTGMEEIPRGTVKWLRVVESPEKRFWTQTAWNGSGTQAPGMAYDDFNNKRILGTVPVEEDGSANFEVPADTFLYFQLLDEEGRMIQSMRSGTIIRPGEQQGCIGCHEDRLDAVAPRRAVQALLRAPSQLESWYGEPRLFSYLEEVQPVFDANCIMCHDVDKPGSKSICLAGDQNLIFNCSYFELRKDRRFVNVPGAGPYRTMLPRSWGSYVSRLAQVALEGHGVPERDQFLDLTQEDKDRIVTWIDINAPYYPRYASAYRNNLYGRSPLDNAQLDALIRLTGIDLKNQNNGNQLYFGRPELSPALASLDADSPEYAEAVTIIDAGRVMLAQRPRAESADFVLTDPTEIAAEEKYQEMLADERARLTAIAEGERLYNSPEEE